MKRRLLAAFTAFFLTATVATQAAEAEDLTRTEVSFRGSGGLTMHGTVLSPAGSAASRPGMVLVHGSGSGSPRTKLMGEAEEFARRGMSVLIYDKRSQGYSLFNRSYSVLADDALGAVAALRSQKGVDPAKVGIWGVSEGGWVAPLAASRSADIAFVVVVGANGLDPLRQQTWAVAAGLRKAGVSGSVVNRAEPTLYRQLADGAMFPEPYHDTRAVLRKVSQPVLAVWGTHDLLTPPQESPPIFAESLTHGHYSLRYFQNADHAAHQTPDGGVTRLPELAPGYADTVGSWVADVTSGKLPNADAPQALPKQASLSIPVPPPAWWEGATVQTIALVLMLLAFAAYPMWALVRRVRGRRQAPAAPWARLVSAAGLVAMLGGFGYLMYLLMTGGKLASPGPLLAGRPLIWLALQALALAAVVATVLSVPGWRRAQGSERVRLSLLLAGGGVFTVWALYWGLLLP